MSPVKEPHYFSQTPDRSPQGRRFSAEEYEALFEGCADGQVPAEGSTSYLGRATVAAPRIAEAVPDARLVFMLRNPIDRAHSDYWFHLYRGELPSRYPFSYYAERPDHWVFNGGDYASNLTTFLDHFRRDQILTPLMQDLRSQPSQVLQDVCRHAGVDPEAAPAEVVRDNVTVYPRSPRLLRTLGRLAPGVGQAMARQPQVRPLRSRVLFSSSSRKPIMRPDVRRRLVERLEETIRELEPIIGRDLSAWLSVDD